MSVNMKETLEKTEEERYVIGCINTSNMETLRAVVDVAEKLNVPIIIDHAQAHDPLISMESVGPKMVEYAKRAEIPVCMHLDHGSDYSFVMRAIRCGFSNVTYDLSALPFEENMAKLKEFTKIARDLNITAEAELGIMTSTGGDSYGGSIGQTHESIKKTFTDPQQVAEFARETGVGALAVCFETAHGIYAEPPLLDIERVKAVRAAMPEETYVVIYGGSGVDEGQVYATITAGCSRVGYYSYMAAATSRYIQEYLSERGGKAFWHEAGKESYRLMKEYAGGVLTVSKNGKQYRG